MTTDDFSIIPLVIENLGVFFLIVIIIFLFLILILNIKSYRKIPKIKKRIKEKPKPTYSKIKNEYKPTQYTNIAYDISKSQPAPTYKYEVIYEYNKRPLLTSNELNFYKQLLPIATKQNLVICPKVRLADLLDHEIKGQSFQGAFAKIKSKHIDFVLCEPDNMMQILAIELDDSSHDRMDRKERDLFVDSALECAGIAILHTRSTEGLADKINKLAYATA